ncbi:MAG TPA: hypothetical protein DDY20_05840 [Desulfobulbaceae bacterium]|nr:hypothetical protein [Desulfobulbaceae bacterium]
MATAREHMQADMAFLFAQEGEEVRDVVIGTTVYRGMVHEMEIDPGPFEGSARRRIAVYLLKGTLSPLPRPDSALEVDGEQFIVDVANPTGLLDVITMGQYN